ncbi:replication protein A 32 kDa subunit-like isoform X1 [Vespa crabro]|uniref:replication protein A 32 kDa subunit-like isoform X1 n=1 Tax=Vespa crabro TaxID=7445 RepID=UPI001F01906F|nr:replication protein A 32 kDa subunit-like isoform X1 [Vespa crabro]
MSQVRSFLNESISHIDETKKKTNRSKKINNIVPLMICHIINLKDQSDELSLWGLPVSIITIVGIVRHAERDSTKVIYDIEDETGTVTALSWVDSNRQLVNPFLLKVNVYVRVYGTIRYYNGKQHILVISIVPIEDLNELTNHILEVTYITLKTQEMAGIDTKVSKAERNVESNTCNNMDPNQSAIFNIILAGCDTDCGIGRAIIKECAPHHLKSQVDTILEFLINEGHIYTTLTNDHFKTT